jgi:tRNA-dihydrouridine synthase
MYGKEGMVTDMRIDFAPLEGITTYTYRKLHHKYYGGIDRYFAPFISPGPGQGLSVKEVRDILPENNGGLRVVPQLMANHAPTFLAAAKVLAAYGYQEINLNLGCPSGTVAAKKKGAGFLAYPEELEAFLEEIFADHEVAAGQIGISIKTRIGKFSAEEWPELMQIYNRFPLQELIVHPRVQKDFYRNRPRWEAYADARRESRNRLVYNGDISTVEEYLRFCSQFPDEEAVMLGRGLVGNPELGEQISRIQNGEDAKALDGKRLRAFHDELLEAYCELMSGERNVLFKMKELWCYMAVMFPDSQKTEKRIKKAAHMREYKEAVNAMFTSPEGGQGRIL